MQLQKSLCYILLLIFLNVSSIEASSNTNLTMTYRVSSTMDAVVLNSAIEVIIFDKSSLACNSSGCVIYNSMISCQSTLESGSTYTSVCHIDGLSLYAANLISNDARLISGVHENIQDITRIDFTIMYGPNLRPPECGNGHLEDGEECDSDVGCLECVITSNYMCMGEMRTEKSIKTGIRCAEPCAISSTKWIPNGFVDGFSPAPAIEGYYCSKTCSQFPKPDGYQSNIDDGCLMEDLNECEFGPISCDADAYCNNLEIQNSDGVPYNCRCDKNFFVVQAGGSRCAKDGVEITVYMQRLQWQANNEQVYRTDLEAIRTGFITAIVASDITRAPCTVAILQEGIEEYPVEITENGILLFKIRIASEFVVMNRMNSFDIFAEDSPLRASVDINADYKMVTDLKCSSDLKRTCVFDSDCINQGDTCDITPRYLNTILNSGGTDASIQVSSSGMSLISVEYDLSNTRWVARVRYDNSISDTMNILYISHVDSSLSEKNPESLATFNVNEFPCQPTGASQFQNRRADNVCCLRMVTSHYTTTQDFFDHLQENSDVASAISNQDACSVITNPPSNATMDLLSAQDFVSGSLARMVRSEAIIDTTSTNGYQDVILHLAEEDMRQNGGIVTDQFGGFSIRFFIGMAHVKTNGPSNTLYSSFSQVEINSDITETFMFTTSAKTDNTFVNDINIGLIEINSGINASMPTKKFARIQLTVPPGSVGQGGVYSIIPHDSLTSSSGFIEGGDIIYPCTDTYVGNHKAELDQFLAVKLEEGNYIRHHYFSKKSIGIA